MTFANRIFSCLLFGLMLLLPAHSIVCGQEDAHQMLNDATDFRSIGPFRGGRSAAVTGVRGKPMLYYQGAAAEVFGKQPMAGRPGRTYQTGILGVPWVRLKSLLPIPISSTLAVAK